MKRLIITVVAAGLLSLGSVGVAAAQTPGGGAGSSTTNPSSSSNAKAHRKGVGVLSVAAQTIGVKPRDLAVGLCGGQTISAIASQHGKSAQDVINALVKAADQRIDQAVASKKINATQAAARKAKVPDRMTKLVNDYKPSAQRCQRLQGAGAPPTST